MNKKPTILTIDLGTQTGWAVQAQTGKISSGTESFHRTRFEGGGMLFLKFKRFLTDLKNRYAGLDYVYFEEVRRHLGTDAAHIYGGFLGQLTAWCEHHNIAHPCWNHQEAHSWQRQCL